MDIEALREQIMYVMLSTSMRGKTETNPLTHPNNTNPSTLFYQGYTVGQNLDYKVAVACPMSSSGFFKWILDE